MTEANALPNIVYILADDLGYGDLSCLNPGSKIPTPIVDGLARSGIVFTDAHSNSAVCTPTRYGVLTGRYAWRTRLKKGVLYGYDEPLIEPGRLTVPMLLGERGYATACVGKWHLGLGWARKPRPAGDAGNPAEGDDVDFAKPLSGGAHTAGFDYSYIIPSSLDIPPYCYVEDGRLVEPCTVQVPRSERPAFWRAGWSAPSFRHETCLLELTKKAVAYIEKRAAGAAPPGGSRLRRGESPPRRPFFLYFPLTSPHTPHVPREPFRGKSRAGEYGDFVVETDWTVGQVLEALRRGGLEENTLVIFTSDNGCHSEPIGLEPKYGHLGNYIYRGQKSDAWDGGHRVPFIARWPGRIRPGSTFGETVCLTDLMATAAALAGARLPNDAGEDSADLLPALLGRQAGPVREATVMHSITGQFAVRQGRWKLVACRGSGGWSLPDAKAPPDAPPMQLYDMQADPRERQNLYGEHPEVVERLAALLGRYQREGRSTPPLR
jgi:arylsulfatase A-like enzyme